MQWVQNTGNQKLVQDFSFEGTQAFKEKFICSDHFLDNDFAVFGQPQSGLRCNAVPHVINLKKKPVVKVVPVLPIKKADKSLLKREDKPSLIKLQVKKADKKSKRNNEDKTSSGSTVSAVPVPDTKKERKRRTKKEKTDEEQLPNLLFNPEVTINESFAQEVLPFGIVKVEPDEIVNPFPHVNPYHTNILRDLSKPDESRILTDETLALYSIQTGSTVRAIPAAVPKKERKKRSKKGKTEEANLSRLLNNPQSTITESYTNEAVSFISRIKEEPSEIAVNALSFPLVDSCDENISATCGSNIATNSIGTPPIRENTLQLPGTSYTLGDAESESMDQLLKSPKREEVDIEEVLLPESILENDGNMEMETTDDESEDTSEFFDVDDPSYLLDISTVEYLGLKKEKSLQQRRKDARRQALVRQRESPAQRAIRLEKTRIRAQERRKAESGVETTLRRYKSAVRAAIKRSTESEEERKIRQEKNRIRAAERRKSMTPEERAIWREKNRIQTRERRGKESDVKKLVRRYNNAIRASMKRNLETPEQRMERRYKDAIRAAQRRKNETAEEREERLRKDRERITLRRLQVLMTETPEQREERLKRERERMYRKRHGILDTTDTSNDSHMEETDQGLSELLCMYPPNVEIETADDDAIGSVNCSGDVETAESVNS